MEDPLIQDDVKSVLRSAVTLYHQGNFTHCRKLIKQQLSKSQKSMITQWILENNQLSAEFHLIDNHQKDTFCVKFYNLLKKTQSLPASVGSVGLELTVLYNGLHSQQPALRSTQHWETILRNTLNRVLDVRGPIRAGKNDTVYSLLEELVNTEFSECLVQDLLPVCLVWVLGLIQIHRRTEAAQILSVINRCKYIQHDELPSNVLRILESCPPSSVKVNFDLCVILLAILSFKKSDFSASRELAMGICTTEYLSISVYIQVLSLLEESDPTEALNILQKLDITLLQKSKASIQARLHCLTGRSLSLQGKPRTAILHQKAALEKDFTYLTPLYYLSVLYRELHMDTAQLEALNLLFTALTADPVNCRSSSPCDCLEDQVMSVLLDTLEIQERLTAIQVQSLLASTCLQLHRYEDAYERYIELLAAAKETDFIKTEGRLICLPELPQVFLDVITSSLNSGRLEECIILCDQAVMSHADQLPPSTEQLTPLSLSQTESSDVNPQTLETSGGKRKRKDSHCDQGDVTQEGYLIKYLLLKADALQRQHNLQESLTILQNVVGKLEKSAFSFFSETADINPVKRARLTSDISDGSEGTESLLLSVYSQLGQVSSLLHKSAQAIHYYRLALLLNTGNKDIVYQLTKSLLSVNRVQEAVVCWSEIREISLKIDTFQINREIQYRETVIQKKRSTEQTDGDCVSIDFDRLKLDIVILKALLHHKHTKIWTV